MNYLDPRMTPYPYRSNASFLQAESESLAKIHKWLTYDDIEDLKVLFKNAPDQKFGSEDFRQLLVKYNIYLNDDEYKTMFLKMNTNRDEHVDWDELISYLILGFQEDDPYNQKESLINPISVEPEIKRSGHRHPVISISYLSTVLPDRSVKKGQGGYITASKDGTVNFWTPELEIQRSGISKNPHLKVTQTWILAVAALSDVRIVCTASSERDLRFYDITAINFNLRIIVNSLPWAVNCMYYHFPKSLQATCKLVLGDFGGHVRLIEFYPELRGPFQNKQGMALNEITWADLVKGRLPQMKVREFPNIHIDMVRQVTFSEYLNSVFSVAECHTSSSLSATCPAMSVIDLGVKKTQSIFHTSKGITCFSLDDENLMLATGGPDFLLRLWNPLVPQKPVATLIGHHAGIAYVFLQPDEKKVYSIDHNKVVKVWDTYEQTILQTYVGLQQIISRHLPFVGYYNKNNHELIVGTRKITSIKCCPLLRMDSTDGETHACAVSVVLYNTLFKSVITCGLDSSIIVWDPWNGKRLTLIKNGHIRNLQGKSLKVEITAACFDPMEQLLLTGAHDGTLKVWNFNSGICMRNLSIEAMCEVTTVFWIKNRILAIGWNRHVTEFADIEGQEYSDGKNWETLHDEDVLCAAINEPDVLATGSYSGDVVLWKLETGQPYRRYSVENPTHSIKLVHGNRSLSDQKKDKKSSGKAKFTKTLRSLSPTRLESINQELHLQSSSEEGQEHGSGNPSSPSFQGRGSSDDKPSIGQVKYVGSPRYRRLSTIQMPPRSAIMRPLSIQAMLFLKTRPQSKQHGSLLVSLENGVVQVFSHHNMGGFIEQFRAIHMPGDCVVAMATDFKNRYLFTATAFGYIKTWLMTNFCVPEEEVEHISMPKLRLQFPFLLKDRFDGRAKRSARGQALPILLNSFKAHLRPISSLQYINQAQILISGSSDNTTRLWSLGGRYLGTLGTPLPWMKLSPIAPVSEMDDNRLPPDIYKVASSTTFKVLNGGKVDRFSRLKSVKDPEESPTLAMEATTKCVYGKPLTEPLLGKHFQLPLRGRPHLKPTLDKTLPYIPVYSHLEIHNARPIERPTTPEVLKRKDLDFLDQ